MILFHLLLWFEIDEDYFYERQSKDNWLAKLIRHLQNNYDAKKLTEKRQYEKPRVIVIKNGEVLREYQRSMADRLLWKPMEATECESATDDLSSSTEAQLCPRCGKGSRPNLRRNHLRGEADESKEISAIESNDELTSMTPFEYNELFKVIDLIGASKDNDSTEAVKSDDAQILETTDDPLDVVTKKYSWEDDEETDPPVIGDSTRFPDTKNEEIDDNYSNKFTSNEDETITEVLLDSDEKSITKEDNVANTLANRKMKSKDDWKKRYFESLGQTKLNYKDSYQKSRAGDTNEDVKNYDMVYDYKQESKGINAENLKNKERGSVDNLRDHKKSEDRDRDISNKGHNFLEKKPLHSHKIDINENTSNRDNSRQKNEWYDKDYNKKHNNFDHVNNHKNKHYRKEDIKKKKDATNILNKNWDNNEREKDQGNKNSDQIEVDLNRSNTDEVNKEKREWNENRNNINNKNKDSNDDHLKQKHRDWSYNSEHKKERNEYKYPRDEKEHARNEDEYNDTHKKDRDWNENDNNMNQSNKVKEKSREKVHQNNKHFDGNTNISGKEEKKKGRVKDENSDKTGWENHESDRNEQREEREVSRQVKSRKRKWENGVEGEFNAWNSKKKKNMDSYTDTTKGYKSVEKISNWHPKRSNERSSYRQKAGLGHRGKRDPPAHVFGRTPIPFAGKKRIYDK